MKTLVFDMYGVIIEESKGNFIPYTVSHFDKTEHERLTRQFKSDRLFTKAGNGEMDSFEFLSLLGYDDPVFHMKNYIENYLTVDKDFYTFADQFINRYHFALLSNDVSAWSRYITEFYQLNKYCPVKIISGDVHCRKPDREIFLILLRELGIPAKDCIFIDNSVENLMTAESLGMDTILFNRDKMKYHGKIVNSFDELAYII